MQGLGATKSRLRNLLKYTDELLSFNEKVAFDLAREPFPFPVPRGGALPIGDLPGIVEDRDEAEFDKIVCAAGQQPAQVATLEGVESALDDETWLRIHRLRETHPPDYDPIFEDWVDFGPHPSADQPPQLAAERVLRLPIEEISDLVEAGLLPDAC
jgi:hypothetical protein